MKNTCEGIYLKYQSQLLSILEQCCTYEETGLLIWVSGQLPVMKIASRLGFGLGLGLGLGTGAIFLEDNCPRTIDLHFQSTWETISQKLNYLSKNQLFSLLK